MHNRDYFTRPIQSGGRSSYDYGRTRIKTDRAPRSDRWWYIGMALVVLWIIAQYAR